MAVTDENIRRNLVLLLAGAKATVGELDERKLAAVLTSLRTTQTLAEHTERLVVKAMRERGATWSDVGRALRVSREAAFQRYRDVD